MRDRLLAAGLLTEPLDKTLWRVVRGKYTQRKRHRVGQRTEMVVEMGKLVVNPNCNL